MKKNKNITILISVLISCLLLSFTISESEDYTNEIIILKLMGEKLESAYIIDNGKRTRVRGATGDVALENYLDKGWQLIGTSVASDAGRFSVVYTLNIKKEVPIDSPKEMIID
jgi:hypothetical protein